MDETEILTEVKAGNTIAFERLYDCYWLKVYNFAQLYITSSFEVSEVVQDVFVKVWESREMFDETKNFDGFLFIITRNIIFNYSRRHFYELNFKMTALRGLENSYDIEDELDAADLKSYIDKLIDTPVLIEPGETRYWVRKLIEQLPPQRRRIFKMSREQHLTNKEIAERCAVSEKAIERQITMALKFLRDNLPMFIVFMG